MCVCGFKTLNETLFVNNICLHVCVSLCVCFIYLSSEGVKPHCLSFSLSLSFTHTHIHSPAVRSSPRAALCSSCCKFVYVCPVFYHSPALFSLIFFLLRSFFGLSCETEVRVHRLSESHKDHRLISRKTLG